MAVDLDVPVGLAALLRPSEGENAAAKNSPMLRAAHNIDRRSAYKDLLSETQQTNAIKTALMQRKMQQDRQKDLLHYLSSEAMLQRTPRHNEAFATIIPELARQFLSSEGEQLARVNEQTLAARNAGLQAKATGATGDVVTETDTEAKFDPNTGATVTKKIATKKKVAPGTSAIPNPPPNADTGAHTDIHSAANRAGFKVLSIEPGPDGSRRVHLKTPDGKTVTKVLPPRSQ